MIVMVVPVLIPNSSRIVLGLPPRPRILVILPLTDRKLLFILHSSFNQPVKNYLLRSQKQISTIYRWYQCKHYTVRIQPIPLFAYPENWYKIP